MTAELKGIHAKTFQDLDVIKDVLKLDEEKIAELEQENAELRNNGFTVSAMTEQQLKVAIEKGEQLEKENAELNEKVNILDNCDRLGDMITEAYKEQLTKATEIIKKLLPCCRNYPQENAEKMEQAKQFIKEIEE